MRARGVVIVALLTAAAPGVARADAEEASLHAHAIFGVARLADGDSTSGEPATAPLAGLAVRGSYATRDWFQYDASVALAATGAATFGEGTFAPPGAPPVTGEYETTAQLARVDAGVTLRLGVRFIPTVRLALGAEGRRVSAPTVMLGAGVERDDVRAASLGVDLLGSFGVGLDVRLDRRNVIGVAVGGSYAVPLGGDAFQTVEGYVHWSRYWYPRW